MEDKMAAGAFERVRNYGCFGLFNNFMRLSKKRKKVLLKTQPIKQCDWQICERKTEDKGYIGAFLANLSNENPKNVI